MHENSSSSDARALLSCHGGRLAADYPASYESSGRATWVSKYIYLPRHRLEFPSSQQVTPAHASSSHPRTSSLPPYMVCSAWVPTYQATVDIKVLYLRRGPCFDVLGRGTHRNLRRARVCSHGTGRSRCCATARRGGTCFMQREAQQENPAGLRHACSSVTLKQWITRDLCLLPAGLVSRPLRCLRQSTQNLHGFPAGSWRTEAAGWFPACCTGRKGGICFPQAEKFDTSPASRDSALTVEKTRVSGNGGVMVVGSA